MTATLILGIIGLVLGLGATISVALNALLALEILTAIAPRTHQVSLPSTTTPNFRVLIPAHNEAAGIEQTLKNLLPEVLAPNQICVIADNCTDATAPLARDLGVEVLERTNAVHKGKGYALDFGLSHLAQDPPEVVVIVDADCQVAPKLVAAIATQAIALNSPVQAIYRMTLPPEPSARDQVSAFAVTVKNQVRAGGLSQLGFPILLGGTGMAFPWESLQTVTLASGHIVEDMKLGIDLAIAGYPPTLATGSQITSQLPSNDSAATSQRTRWEHGHLQVLTTYVPQLLQAAFSQKRLGLLIMALDLSIPPLALWVMLGIGLSLLTGSFALLSNIVWPFYLQSAAEVLLIASVLTAWAKWGQQELPLRQLLAVPLYLLWKLPIYLKFIVNPQNTWVRTERD